MLSLHSTATELRAWAADPALRAQVAAHPNTPPELLATLAAEYPGEVLSNPALALLKLARPQLLLEWPRPAVLNLIQHPLAPGWLRQFARQQRDAQFQRALVAYPGLSLAELEELANHPHWAVRAGVAVHPHTSSAVLEGLAQDPDYAVRLQVARREDASQAARAALTQDTVLVVRRTAGLQKR